MKTKRAKFFARAESVFSLYMEHLSVCESSQSGGIAQCKQAGLHLKLSNDYNDYWHEEF